MVNLNRILVDVELMHHLFNHQYNLSFTDQWISAHHIGIALIKFAIPSFLRPVGTPHGLNLVAFKRQGYFVAVHHHVAGKGNSEVVAKAEFWFLRKPKFVNAIEGINFFSGESGSQTFVRPNLINKFTSFFTIFSFKCIQIFHSWGLQRLKAILLEDGANSGENKLALGHFSRPEIACSFR